MSLSVAVFATLAFARHPILSAPAELAPPTAQGSKPVTRSPSGALERFDFTSEGGGGARSAWIKKPQGEGPWPVMIAYHGGKDNDGHEMIGKLAYAEDKGILLVYANGADTAKGRGWTGPGKMDGEDPMRDVRYTEDLIEALKKAYPVDEQRIFAVGMSGGAYMVDVLWCTLSDKIAGFGAVSRSMPKVVSETCVPARPRPYMLVLGTADDGLVSEHQLPIEETRAFIRKHLECKEEPKVRETVPDKGDSVTVNRAVWSCGRGAEFWDYEVVGGGHTWPGIGKPRSDKAMDINATQEMLKLFGLE